jgi:uncharacterized membrane protein YfcA
MISTTLAIAAVSIAILAGFLAAIAGLGGGFLYVPILILLFGLDPISAVGTSLLVIICSTLVASISYFRQGRIFFRSAICLILPSSICAIIGASLTAVLTGVVVALLFSVMVGILSLKLLYQDFPFVQALKRGPSFEEIRSDSFSITVKNRFYYANYLLWGSLAGLASGLTGIGGGVINVPAMVTAGMPVHYAVATSTVVVLFTSTAGAGIHATLGHINSGYALFLSIGAVIGAYAGTLAVPRIPEYFLRKGVGILLACIAVIMFINTILGP